MEPCIEISALSQFPSRLLKGAGRVGLGRMLLRCLALVFGGGRLKTTPMNPWQLKPLAIDPELNLVGFILPLFKSYISGSGNPTMCIINIYASSPPTLSNSYCSSLCPCCHAGGVHVLQRDCHWWTGQW